MIARSNLSQPIEFSCVAVGVMIAVPPEKRSRSAAAAAFASGPRGLPDWQYRMRIQQLAYRMRKI